MPIFLDWKISDAEQRAAFVRELDLSNLSARDIERVSTYVLYGQDPDGKNPVQKRSYYIPSVSARSPWTRTPKNGIVSLDQLQAEGAVPESSLHPLNGVRYTAPRVTFDRSAITSPDLLRSLQPLWEHIDYLDLLINEYEILIGKRLKEPRSVLLKRFTDEERLNIQRKALTLNEATFLRCRHLLVELRQEQFTLRDQFVENRRLPRSSIPNLPLEILDPFFSESVLGVASILPFPPPSAESAPILELIFSPFSMLNPANPLIAANLRSISDFLWHTPPAEEAFFFDLRRPEHWGALISSTPSGSFLSEGDISSKNLSFVMNYYIREAELPPIFAEILRRKWSHESNQTIRSFVNKTYNKSYSLNYISTIYRQKILPRLAATARLHYDMTRDLFYPENFKKCRVCGTFYYLSTENYCRKKRSSDGYASRCKKCDKERRLNQ